ncbi:MAG TPA: helix-turn-helix transcriptional regulator [Candidatus Elarobacter sp.]|jgi:DNA-binding CsgD family transcriptional regulator
MRQWFAGEFERCLDTCDHIRQHRVETRVNVALLRARALLRLDRPDDALRALDELVAVPMGTDESITLRMLRGAASVRRGEARQGLDELLAAALDSSNAHPTIRSEVNLNVGLAYYALHDFDSAERALSQVAEDSDLVHARATQYLAWIAQARSRNERSTELFMAALDMLDRCEHYDRFFEANCVRALAHLALERLDGGTWDVVDARRSKIDWSAKGLAQPRFYIAFCAAAFQLDVAGNTAEAYREARFAERIAPSDAFRVQARCARAWIARETGEHMSQRDHVEAALELFQECDAAAFSGDETLVPLILAEELAAAGHPSAEATLAIYQNRVRPAGPVLAVKQSIAAEAYRWFIEATVLEAAGSIDTALALYRKTHATLERLGYERHAIMAALPIARRTGDRKLRSYAIRATSRLPATSALRRNAETVHALRVRLTDVQREVVVLICQGKSNPEIARLRKRSLHTVRNLVARLFEIFEVNSREQLAVECVRRGLYSPDGASEYATRRGA